MDVKFNSSLGFGAKRVPSYTKAIEKYRNTHTVINPLESPTIVKGFDHNIDAVDSLPGNVLKAVVKKLQGRGLFVKPEEIETKSFLQDLVCDITDIGKKARKVLNDTVMKSYKTRIKANRTKIRG